MGNIPEGDPVGQSTGQPIQEGRVPGFVTQAITSLPTDPDQKRRILDKQIFPDLDQKDAESRIFPGVNGRLAAVGQDGKPYYVEPLPSSVATDPYSPASVFSTLPRTPPISGLGLVPSPSPALPAVGGAVAGRAGRTDLVATWAAARQHGRCCRGRGTAVWREAFRPNAWRYALQCRTDSRRGGWRWHRATGRRRAAQHIRSGPAGHQARGFEPGRDGPCRERQPAGPGHGCR